MSKKFFTLPTCKTCQRIEADLNPSGCGAEVRDIKSKGVTAEELDAMHAHSGSYEVLFSRRAMKFRSMGLGDRDLSEADYRQLILEFQFQQVIEQLVLNQQILQKWKF